MTETLEYFCIGHLSTVDRQYHASFSFLTQTPTILSLARTFTNEAEDDYKKLAWNKSELTLDVSFAIGIKDSSPTYKIYIGTINGSSHFTVLATSQEECKALLEERVAKGKIKDTLLLYDFETTLPVRNWHYVSKVTGQQAKKMIQKFVPRVLEFVLKQGDNILVYVNYKVGRKELITNYNHKLFVIDTAA